MPVTAKLSRRFYEAFGDEIANELVDWFNAVDRTYRGELRDLNELNFARFDAKLEQRIGQLDAKIEQRFAQVETRFEVGFASSTPSSPPPSPRPAPTSSSGRSRSGSGRW